MTPPNIVSSALVTTNNNTLAQTSGTNVLKLVGFEEALQKAKTRCKMPKVGDIMTPQNVFYGIVAANGAGDNLVGNLTSDSISATALAGGSIVISGATQLYKFCQKHWGIQALQESFIKALPQDIIGNCVARGKTLTVNSAEDIIKALNDFGLITITLNPRQQATKDYVFSLRNNGFLSLRLGAGALFSLGISAACAYFYVASQLDAINSNNVSGNADTDIANASPYALTSLAIASAPINKMYDFIINSFYRQELAVIDAIKKVVDMYQDTQRMHAIPLGVLQASEPFLEKTEVIENYEIRRSAITQQLIYINTQNLNNALDDAKQKTEQLELQLKQTNLALATAQSQVTTLETHQQQMTDEQNNILQKQVEQLQQIKDLEQSMKTEISATIEDIITENTRLLEEGNTGNNIVNGNTAMLHQLALSKQSDNNMSVASSTVDSNNSNQSSANQRVRKSSKTNCKTQ